MLARLFSLGGRALCLLVGAGVFYGLFRGASEILLPDLRAWTALLGPVWALAGAALAALLSRCGLAPGRLLTRVPAPVFSVAVFVLALAAGIWAHFAIQKGLPDVPDELSYLHQARGFADGFIAPPSPPLAEFHYVSWGVHDRGLWYSVFPPGYGVLLAVGVKLGVPFLVNPLLGALLALALFALGREIFGGDGVAARAAVLLHLASWFTLMHAGSFMAHPTAALLTVLCVLGAWRGVLAGGSAGWGLVAGAALAGLAATRPLNAVILGAVLLPAVIYALVVRRAPLRRLLPPIAAMAPLLVAYGLYNRALTGSASVAPQQRYMVLKEERGDCFRLGFGPGVGQCPITQNTHFGPEGFQPRHARKNTALRLDAYLRYSFALSPLAAIPAAGALAGAFGPGRRRRGLLCLLLLASIFGYALFFYHGVAYGARFLYETFPFVALLGAAFVADVARLLARRPLVRAALGGALAVTVATGLAATWPLVQKHAGRRARTGNGAWLEPLHRPELAGAVVFVDSMIIPAAATEHPGRIDDNHPIVVRDNGDAANAGFMRLYPDRAPHRLSGTRVAPLTYAPDAPIRHEGGALYPLEISVDGFGERVTTESAFRLPLEREAALRFRGRAAGARFAIPSWTPDDGPATLRLAVVAHPGGPTVDVFLDGAPAGSVDSAARPAAITLHELPIVLTRGRHWIELRLRKPGAFFLDYVELARP